MIHAHVVVVKNIKFVVVHRQMDTKVLKINSKYDFNSEEFIKLTSDVERGSLVAFPTETVYGLGANALLENAVNQIFAAKGRPSDNPLIIHISEFSEIYKYGNNISKVAEKLASVFWPGPLTMVVEKNSIIPDKTSGGLSTVGIRFPKNIVAQKLIKGVGFPIAAPSANLSGKPSTTSGKHVLDDLFGLVEYIIISDNSEIGLESTIIDVTKDIPELLRPGSITIDEIEEVIGKISVDKSIINSKEIMEKPKAPGMKYKHYSPMGNLFLFIGNNKISKIMDYGKRTKSKFGVICSDENMKFYEELKCPLLNFGSNENLEQVCKNIYSCLRECDDLGLEEIFCEGFSKEKLGLTIMNRLEKAAKLIINT